MTRATAPSGKGFTFPDFQHHRENIRSVIDAVLRASDPRACTAAALRATPPRGQRLAVVAVGKAAPAMLEGFREVWQRPHDALMVVPHGAQAPPGAIVADHPVPTAASLRAVQRTAEFVTSAASGVAGHDGIVVLLSGGASSLLTWPVDQIPFDRYAPAIEELLRTGIDIRTLNTVRKHADALKGGRLGLLTGPLACDTYILSDVVGDDLSTIGSGPTVPDPTTFAEACDPFAWELEFTLAERVVYPFLREGALGYHAETPKPGDPGLANVRPTLVGGNTLAARAAARVMEALGFGLSVRESGVEGEASEVGRRLAAAAHRCSPFSAVVYAGETTVTVRHRSGTGGRNQELALAAALELDRAGRPSRLPPIVIAAFATDGVDGPTDAAGAIVTRETCRTARAIGLDPSAALADHDSHTFFSRLDRAGHGHLIRTGPTGTNVSDIAVALVYPP